MTATRLAAPEQVWAALTDGLARFVTDAGFDRVVLGSSGGIDSAVVAAVAVDALGAGRVRTIAMPGPHSSDESAVLAAELAGRLGCTHLQVPVTGMYDTFDRVLWGTGGPLRQYSFGVAKENLQARLRGTLLMAVSNQTGELVLACGNRSEASVGYFTLYGDSCGSLEPIGGVFKTDVYALARWRNDHNPDGTLLAGTGPIPERILTRAPSAELAPGQVDATALPADYPVLDAILAAHLDGGADVDALTAAGFDRAVADAVVWLVGRSAFKRDQMPPVLAVPAGPVVPARGGLA